MHDLSTETPFTKYSLRGALFDPITGTMMALTAAGAGVSAMGTIAGGNAAAAAGQAGLDAGMRQQQALEFRAKQEEIAANESRAVAQRSAIEQQRKGRFVLSELQAKAAASGGGADDPTVLNLAGGIAQRSEYDALFDMANGENKARGLEDQAVGSRLSGEAALAEGYGRLAEGKAKQSASRLSALGTIIGGAGSMFGQYNKIPSYRYG